LLLVTGAGLFLRTLQNLNGQDAGFDRESVLMVRVEPKGSDQRGVPGTSVRLDRTYKQLLQHVETIPSVYSASLAQFSPTSRVAFGSPVQLPSGEERRVSILMVYPNYFKTVAIPFVAGRDFAAGDLEESSPLVAIVNETFARQAFGQENPIGKQLPLARRQLIEIIGVVKDSRYSNLRDEPVPVMYQTFFQTRTGRGQMTLHVRTRGNRSQVIQHLREAVHEMDRELPLFEVRSLAEEMDARLIRERLIAMLSTFFSGAALLLAGVGLYGLLAFQVVQRTGEMGIRIALGARRADVAWMVVRDALWLVALGILVGVPAAFVAGKVASSQIAGLLFGLTSTDTVTLCAAAAIPAITALVAAYLPAQRASGVDPIIALRNE
jgi:predicted permease